MHVPKPQGFQYWASVSFPNIHNFMDRWFPCSFPLYFLFFCLSFLTLGIVHRSIYYHILQRPFWQWVSVHLPNIPNFKDRWFTCSVLSYFSFFCLSLLTLGIPHISTHLCHYSILLRSFWYWASVHFPNIPNFMYRWFPCSFPPYFPFSCLYSLALGTVLIAIHLLLHSA